VYVVVEGNGQLLDPMMVETCIVGFPDRVRVLAGPHDEPDKVTGGKVTVEPCSVTVLAVGQDKLGPQDDADKVTVDPCSVIVLTAWQDEVNPQDDPGILAGGKVTVDPCSVIVLATGQDEGGRVTVDT
jgi:hypothetical protein